MGHCQRNKNIVQFSSNQTIDISSCAVALIPVLWARSIEVQSLIPYNPHTKHCPISKKFLEPTSQSVQ